MKPVILLICVVATACGDVASKEKKASNNMQSNNTVATNNTVSTNNGTTGDCCQGLQCGGSPTCVDVVCGTCDDMSVCSDTQQCEALPEDGPRIVDLAINTTTATPSTTLTISALVTDPDGVDDLIGGTLKSPAGASYGAFQTSEGSSYELTVTWSQLNAVQPIVFDAPIGRDLVAEFYDQAGNKVQRTLSINLACDGTNGAACEAGTCFDLNNSLDHCGACGAAVQGEAYCSQGQPTCSSGDYCPASGVCSGFYEPKACGSCGNSCEAKATQLGLTFDAEGEGLNCLDGSTCQIYKVSTVPKSCQVICGAATCYTSSASFVESGVSADCGTDWSEPRWVADYGAFIEVGCTCTY